MATLDALTSPIKAVIYKKTLDNGQTVYVPYLPRTDAEWVSLNEAITVHGDNYVANTDLETIIKALNDSIGTPNATVSSATSASLQAQINYISQELISKSGAFVYKGSADPSQATSGIINPDPNAKPGWVYNVSTPFNITTTGGIQYVASQKDAQYSAGTNVVVIGSGTTGDPFKFDPLAGDMGNHALTSEAIGSAVLNGNTITFKYVDNNVAGTITFNTIGTTAVGTTSITTTITSASSTAIPTEGAVYNYASSAGKVKVTAATEGYLIGVATYSATDADTARSPLDFNIHVTGGGSTTPTLGANITGKAATAGTADKVGNTFTVAGQAFDGSAAKTISVGNGLTTTTSGNTTTISIGEGDGITVDANGISVNAGNGLAYSNDQIVAKATAGLTVTASGIGISNTVASGVYSAVAVNQYGLATAGAQSIIFAKGINDPDLDDLVVGGLAFIGTSTAAADTYTGTAKSTGTVGVMDDAE